MAKLIYLVGASGSGKDSLLQALREQQTAPLLVAHRYITRACHAGSETTLSSARTSLYSGAAKDFCAALAG